MMSFIVSHQSNMVCMYVCISVQIAKYSQMAKHKYLNNIYNDQNILRTLYFQFSSRTNQQRANYVLFRNFLCWLEKILTVDLDAAVPGPQIWHQEMIRKADFHLLKLGLFYGKQYASAIFQFKKAINKSADVE